MGIQLHPKHGLNPTMTNCYFCGEPSEILLVGIAVNQFKKAGVHVSKDGRMPHEIGYINTNPCQKCEGYMKQGIMFISIRDGEEKEIEQANQEKRIPNPHRTGKICVITEAGLHQMRLSIPLEEQILHARFVFIPDTTWGILGLPTGKEE